MELGNLGFQLRSLHGARGHVHLTLLSITLELGKLVGIRFRYGALLAKFGYALGEILTRGVTSLDLHGQFRNFHLKRLDAALELAHLLNEGLARRSAVLEGFQRIPGLGLDLLAVQLIVVNIHR